MHQLSVDNSALEGQKKGWLTKCLVFRVAACKYFLIVRISIARFVLCVNRRSHFLLP